MDKSENLKNTIVSSTGVIIMAISLLVAYIFYHQILGNPSNFIDGDVINDPKEGNYLGVIHKGGPIVILQLSFIIILFTYIIERAINLYYAAGKGSNKKFARDIEQLLTSANLEGAEQLSMHQKGSLGNVVFKGLHAYQNISGIAKLRPEEKAFRIKQELEEATHLEVPVLEKNMIIISTLASIATLVGLLGTVTGMIRAFSALAQSGTPDAIGLAGGISQALITTALGISTSAIAIVFYNFYSKVIDRITYAIDHTNYAILNHFKQSSENQP